MTDEGGDGSYSAGQISVITGHYTASIGKWNMLCDYDLIGVGGQKEDRDWLTNLSGMVMGCDNAIDDSIMAACDHELNKICDDICSALTWTALWTKDNAEAK